MASAQLAAELTGTCRCGLVRAPMSLYRDCERGRWGELGVDLRGRGWRLLCVGVTMWAYCGWCGRVDPSCDAVDARDGEPPAAVAARHGWVLGRLMAASTRHGGMRVYTAAPEEPIPKEEAL